MKYVSIDTETLGLDPETCDLIEFAAVADDLVQPLEKLPRFRSYILRNVYRGEPYAMAMNAEILRTIAEFQMGKVRVELAIGAEGFDWTNLFLPADMLGSYFSRWLQGLGLTGRVVAAGKNFAGFDLRFIRRQPNFACSVQFHHRSLDPGTVFTRAEDDFVPDTKACLERAGLAGEVKHRALDDAMDVVKLVRKHLVAEVQ